MGKGNAVDGCGSCLKAFMIGFNVLFWLLGLAVLIVGIVMMVSPGVAMDMMAKAHITLDNSTFPMKTAAILLIIAGSITFVLGFLGCCGAWKESKCLLGMFFALMLVMVIIEVAAGILIAVLRPKIQSMLNDAMSPNFIKIMTYGNDTEAINGFHAMETELKCCGVNGTADYGNIFPATKQRCAYNVTTPDPPGCVAALFTTIDKYAIIIMGIGIGIGAVEIFGLIFSMVLCCKIRNE